MFRWPEITEPLLAERQGMSQEQFREFLDGLLEAIGTRELDEEHYERAIGYPWERPSGSCLVTDGLVENLAEIDAGRRDMLIRRYLDDPERIPLLAYGANGAPRRLALKLAHLPEGEREALVLAGDLLDFDVGAMALPPLFSSMAGTLIPSAGTASRVGVLYLTPVQFTALWWTELNYKVGELAGVELVTDFGTEPIGRVIAFIGRWGAFGVDGDPVVMAALAGRNRRYPALTQVEILDAAARISLGEEAGAYDLIKGAFENPAQFMAGHHRSFAAASIPFQAEHWTEMPTGQT